MKIFTTNDGIEIRVHCEESYNETGRIFKPLFFVEYGATKHAFTTMSSAIKKVKDIEKSLLWQRLREERELEEEERLLNEMKERMNEKGD